MAWEYIPLLDLPEGGPEDYEMMTTTAQKNIADALSNVKEDASDNLHYIYYNKEYFVHTVLYCLCKAACGDLNRLEYVYKDTGEELVHIIYDTSNGEYKRTVNVTGDSLTALARDVLKYLN